MAFQYALNSITLTTQKSNQVRISEAASIVRDITLDLVVLRFVPGLFQWFSNTRSSVTRLYPNSGQICVQRFNMYEVSEGNRFMQD